MFRKKTVNFTKKTNFPERQIFLKKKYFFWKKNLCVVVFTKKNLNKNKS